MLVESQHASICAASKTNQWSGFNFIVSVVISTFNFQHILATLLMYTKCWKCACFSQRHCCQHVQCCLYSSHLSTLWRPKCSVIWLSESLIFVLKYYRARLRLKLCVLVMSRIAPHQNLSKTNRIVIYFQKTNVTSAAPCRYSWCSCWHAVWAMCCWQLVSRQDCTKIIICVNGNYVDASHAILHCNTDQSSRQSIQHGLYSGRIYRRHRFE